MEPAPNACTRCKHCSHARTNNGGHRVTFHPPGPPPSKPLPRPPKPLVPPKPANPPRPLPPPTRRDTRPKDELICGVKPVRFWFWIVLPAVAIICLGIAGAIYFGTRPKGGNSSSDSSSMSTSATTSGYGDAGTLPVDFSSTKTVSYDADATDGTSLFTKPAESTAAATGQVATTIVSSFITVTPSTTGPSTPTTFQRVRRTMTPDG